MIWLSAGWLWLLVPWSLLAIWLWRMPAQSARVTASFLWPGGRASPSTFALRQLPPTWALCLLSAMLLGVLSLAEPAWMQGVTRVGVVVDPSARLLAGGARDEQLDRCRDLADRFPFARVSCLSPGHPNELSLEAALGVRPTARLTNARMAVAIESALGRYDVVAAISADPIDIASDRLAVLAPTLPDNVGIDRFGFSASPSAVAWAKLSRDGDVGDVTLEVRAGDVVSTRPIAWQGSTYRDITLDVGASTETVQVRVQPGDAFPLDDVATLVRRNAWPRLVAEASTTPFVRRFVQAYSQTREPTTNSADVRLGESSAALIQVGHSFDGSATGVVLVPHPILNGLRQGDLEGRRVDAALPAGEWSVIARTDRQPIIAVMDSPVRRVWVGVELGATVDDVAGVTILTAAVDWVNGGERPTYEAVTPDDVAVDWTPVDLVDPRVEASPGVYLDPAGRRVAVNLSPQTRAGAASRGDLERMVLSHRRSSALRLSDALRLLAGLSAALGGVVYGVGLQSGRSG